MQNKIGTKNKLIKGCQVLQDIGHSDKRFQSAIRTAETSVQLTYSRSIVRKHMQVDHLGGGVACYMVQQWSDQHGTQTLSSVVRQDTCKETVWIKANLL